MENPRHPSRALKHQIAHLDINSFFASIEQQANPYLQNKPVGIIKAASRTCVIAASHEAKELGIETGCRTWEAKALCPKIIFVPADFEKYFPLTQKLIHLSSLFCPEVEVFSLDEVFLDLTGYSHLFGGPIKTIQRIQKKVTEEIGDQITLSAGLSYNRLLAKLASDLAGKNQILVITKGNRDAILAKIRPSTICGIGHRIEARLATMGITNLLQIRKIKRHYLIASFGPWWAQRLKEISWGIDHSSLTTLAQLPLPKSVSRTFTLFENTKNLGIIKATLRNLAEEVSGKLRKLSLVSRTVGLSIRGGNQEFNQEKTSQEFTDDGIEIFKRAWQIFQEARWPSSVHFLGIRASNLAQKGLLTPSFLPEDKKRERVLKAIDQVNTRFGPLTIFPGVLLGQKLIRPEVTGFLADKKLRFNTL